MGLNKTALATALKNVFAAGFPAGVVTPGSVQDTEMTNLSNGIANAIDAYVTSADVLYVTGTLTSPSGTVTGSPTTTIATLK